MVDDRVLPLSLQRSFRDGAFRTVADGGVVVTAGVTAILRPSLAARFLTVSRRKEEHRYGPHPRQVPHSLTMFSHAPNNVSITLQQ